jgi:hypothetical protein
MLNSHAASMRQEATNIRKYLLARQAYTARIAVYVFLGTAWAAFAHFIAPHIIVAAHANRSFSMLNRIFQGNRDLPVEHYLHSWNLFTGAIDIALVLHFVIVLFIASIDRRHKLRLRDAAKTNANTNIVLIAFSAVFLTTTAITGFSKGDYGDYDIEWTSILNGQNPWNLDDILNAYGPLFNVLAPMTWLNPLFNKLLFAFSYLVYVIWLIRVHGPRCSFDASSWFCYGLLILNPFPWVQLAYLGHFDVLVGLACVAAVHSLVYRKDALSGIYLACGILLKFIPIVILPFLAFNGRRFHFCLVGCCFLASVLVWGTSTFAPLAFAATRAPTWSIYSVMNSQYSPLQLIWDTPHAEGLEKPLLLTAGLSIFIWCTLRQVELPLSATLAILVTLLLYRVGFPNYHLVFLCMVSYWVVSEWRRFSKKTVLATLLIGYFNFLAVAVFSYWLGISKYIFYSTNVIALLQFLLGCTVLAGFIRFASLSARSARKFATTDKKHSGFKRPAPPAGQRVRTRAPPI